MLPRDLTKDLKDRLNNFKALKAEKNFLGSPQEYRTLQFSYHFL